MNKMAYDRRVAAQQGEIVPSLIKLRRFKGARGYPSAVGYYEARFKFYPIANQPLKEPIAVQPHEIEEAE